MWRVLAALVLMAAPAECEQGEPEALAYRCQVSNKVDSAAVGVKAEVVTAAVSRAGGFAMLRNPAGGGSRYAAALAYGLGGGVYAGAQVGVRLPRMVGQAGLAVTRGVESSVTGGARVAFVYESEDEEAMRAVLERTWPPAGWNRMTVELGTSVAGSAEIGAGVLAGVRVSGEASTAAELTVYPGGGVAVARAWRGTVTTGTSGDGPALLGLTAGWEGTFTVSYTLRFGADMAPRQLTVVTEIRAGDTLTQTTRILDLRGGRNVAWLEDAWPELLLSPFPPVAHSAGIFLTSASAALWRRTEKSGTTVRAVYALTGDDREYALAYGFFGGSLQTGTLDTRLQSLRITKAGTVVPQKCVAVPAPSRPPLKEPATLPTLPPPCLPPTVPTPSDLPTVLESSLPPEITPPVEPPVTDPATVPGDDCGRQPSWSPSPTDIPTDTPTGTPTPTDSPSDTPTPDPSVSDTPDPGVTTADPGVPSPSSAAEGEGS
ncbi:hypothetical protein GCM10009677_12550 [Sphaerisporangium rubeum]